jgi:hypothetical protein
MNLELTGTRNWQNQHKGLARCETSNRATSSRQLWSPLSRIFAPGQSVPLDMTKGKGGPLLENLATKM